MKQSKGPLPQDHSAYAKEQIAMKEYVKLLNEDTGEFRMPAAAPPATRTRRKRT